MTSSTKDGTSQSHQRTLPQVPYGDVVKSRGDGKVTGGVVNGIALRGHYHSKCVTEFIPKIGFVHPLPGHEGTCTTPDFDLLAGGHRVNELLTMCVPMENIYNQLLTYLHINLCQLFRHLLYNQMLHLSCVHLKEYCSSHEYHLFYLSSSSCPPFSLDFLSVAHDERIYC